MAEKSKKNGRKKKTKRVPYHRQPEDLSLRDWQIALRRQYGEKQEFTLPNLGDHPVWSDFTVGNPGRNTAGSDSLQGLVKTELFPYQREGVLFAFRAGRCLLADEMGLGKTPQAIATAELYRRELGIGSVFIVCPTSLKYQWRAEIRRFAGSSVRVIEGPMHKRREQYAEDESFYKILTYNVVARDYTHINAAAPRPWPMKKPPSNWSMNW